MVQVVPAILTNNIVEAKDLILKAESKVDRIQIDIVDGVFADNKTIDPSIFEEIDTNLKLDFHLMTKDPIDWIERCVHGMADRIIGQVEMMSDQTAFVGKLQEVGVSIGLAIDLETPVSKIDATIINNLDVVLVMSVKAGFGGQKFDPSALLRVNELDEIRVRDDTPFRICVDGGVDYSNIKDIVKSGVDEVAIGRRIFKGDLKNNIEKFLKKAYA